MPVIGITALLGAVALSWRPDGKLHVHVFNVDNMPVFVQTPTGKQILIGGSNSPSALLAALGARLPFWDRDIDLVVVPQADAKSLNGLMAVVDRYHVGAIASVEVGDNRAAREWLDMIAAKQIEVIKPGLGNFRSPSNVCLIVMCRLGNNTLTRLSCLLAIGFAMTLTACGPATSGATGVGTPIVGTPSFGTAVAGTIEPIVITDLPPDYTPPPTAVPPTPTPIPTLPGGLGPTEPKYRVLAQFPDFFFCDPDYYPVAREDELDLARQRFPELQANTEEFNTILAHNSLAGLSTFTDDQKLLIYREHKRLAALQFELTATGYQFQIQVAETEGSGELITGLIDSQGTITVQQRAPTIATCPICLAADTLIDTPTGPIPVQSLRVGTLVWTMDKAGVRMALPLARISKTVVPANHQVVHLVLDDGREVWVSPGHPTAEGHTVGQLQIGDSLDGALLLSTERVPYTGHATYDLLPSGQTGFYWANGILIASSLVDDPGSDEPFGQRTLHFRRRSGAIVE